MDKILSSVLIVDANGSGPNVYPTIEQATLNSKMGDTIIITAGTYQVPILTTVKHTKLFGMEGVIVYTKNLTCPLTTIENIVFHNMEKCCLYIRDSPDVIFRNCELHCKSYSKFCVRLKNSSVIYYNTLFLISCNNSDIVQVITSKDCKYLIFQSPIVRIAYENIKCLETFVAIAEDCGYTTRLECFGLSLQYKTTNCCRTNIRLVKSIGNVNSSFMSTHTNFIGGKGSFELAQSEAISYINSITITGDNQWSIGPYSNLLLNGFISNLKGACAIDQNTCPTSDCIDPCINPYTSEYNDNIGY